MSRQLLVEVRRLGVIGQALALGLVCACVAGTPNNPALNNGYDPQINLSTQPARGLHAGVSQGNGTQVVYFDDSGDSHAVPPGIQAAAQGYTVNLQAVAVDVAAQSLLSGILQVPYSLDPNVTGTVTMATGGPVPRSELLMLFEEALQANGLILVGEGSGFRIKQQDGSVVTAGLRAEGYGFTAIPLRHLGAKRMLALLDGFAAPAGAIRASENDDMILAKGTERERSSIAQMVSSLDVDMLAKPNAGIAFLQNANAESVQGELGAVAADDPAAAGWDVQVLQRSNAILVQAHSRSDLEHAMAWIRRLDQVGGAQGGDIVVYKVQYAKASQLAGLLQATFGDGGSVAKPAAAPAANVASATVATDEAAPAAPGAETASVQTVAATGGGEVRFTPNDSDNTIIIRAPNPVRSQALKLLATIDAAPVQVLIDVMLIEVTLNDATSLGVQAYLQGKPGALIASNGTTTAIAPSAPGFSLVLGNGVNPRVIIDTLSQVTKVKVVSAPSIAAFQNEEAEIKVVEQVPIVTQQVTSTTTPNAPVVNSVEYHDAGVILKVTPQVSQTDLVNLQVSQELSAVVTDTNNANNLNPTLRERSINTRVAVYDNQTVALGGLISSQNSTGKNRLFGLFTNNFSNNRGRTELIVFITPHIVRNQQDASSISKELRAKMTAMSGASP